MTIHQKRNHTMQNSMDTNWAVTKPLTIWYTIYIYIYWCWGGSIGVPSYFTSCEESALGTDSSWNYCLVVRYWGKAPKIPEKPRASLPWTIGEKSFPKKKTGSGLFEILPQPGAKSCSKICGLMNDICVFVKGNFIYECFSFGVYKMWSKRFYIRMNQNKNGRNTIRNI